MAKTIDLTGKIFSKLTVVSEDLERNNQLKKERSLGLRTNAPVHWICQCECGNRVSVVSQRLRSGKTTSCGCNYKKYDFTDKEMIGKHLNSWTVVSYSYFDEKTKKHYFNCECDCGTLQVVDGYNLIQGLSKNCGCKRKTTLKEMMESDLCGQVFGKLTVISKIGFTKARKVIYECRCECGQITSVVGSSLVNGHTSSCGCILSKQNIKIAEVLEEIGIDFKREKTFKTKEFNGRFDFFIPSLETAIEYDGEQHYFPIDFAGKGEEWAIENFKITKVRDNNKNNYCKNNNIRLLRIPYYKKNDIEAIIKDFLNLP